VPLGRFVPASHFSMVGRYLFRDSEGIVIPTSSDYGWRVTLPILETTGSDPNRSPSRAAG
jgi:hypothetical protein